MNCHVLQGKCIMQNFKEYYSLLYLSYIFINYLCSYMQYTLKKDKLYISDYFELQAELNAKVGPEATLKPRNPRQCQWEKKPRKKNTFL